MPYLNGKYTIDSGIGKKCRTNALNIELQRIREQCLRLSKEGKVEYIIPIKELINSLSMLHNMLTIVDKFKVNYNDEEFIINWSA